MRENGRSDTLAKANGRGRPKISREETLGAINEHLSKLFEILDMLKASQTQNKVLRAQDTFEASNNEMLETLLASHNKMTNLGQLIQYYLKTVNKRR